MTGDLTIGILLAVFGAVLAVHCGLATRREIKAGVARNLVWDYSRRAEPIMFWLTIFCNLGAALLGVLLLFLGCFRLLPLLG